MLTASAYWSALSYASILLATACSEDCGVPLAFATVTVTDAGTGDPICGATVTASFNGQNYVAEASPEPCEYTLWSAVTNTDLTLLVEADGYLSYVDTFRVAGDDCGPTTTQPVDVELEPD
jgi:hypothetical protein